MSLVWWLRTPMAPSVTAGRWDTPAPRHEYHGFNLVHCKKVTMNTLPLPASIGIITESGAIETTFSADGIAGHEDISVKYSTATGQLQLTARASRVKRLILRWPVSDRNDIPHSVYLADHWERSDGDLEWRALRPDRVMPWYFCGMILTAARMVVA